MVSRRLNLRSIANALIGFAALLVCGIAAADPPARVARLANIGGAVSFSPAGEDEWTYATPNRPLITGDRVWADTGARAELQIGSLAVRLGSQTSVTILNLDDRVAQFQLAQGALNVRVRRIDPGQTIEIDTPLLAFSLRRPGDYRIDVDPTSAATTVAVRSGEGEVYGEGAAYVISARQWYRFADSGLRDYQYDALPPPDAFDNWARDRDRRQDNPVAARYVSPDVIGYSDLDDYGTWSVVEGYGNVWVPTSVASDWAPYHNGHWTWIEPWGWTWVDDAPWGFAPFHYGRWAYARQRWCWVPGPVRARSVYAPALVAFVGGNNFRISVGAGEPSRGVAWFPLAPGEVYRPAYRVSRNYFTNVNVSNTNVSNTYVTNVYNRPDAPNTVYRNREQRGAITAVPAAAFVQSRPVAQSAVPISREVAAAAPVTPVASFAPVRASVIGGGAAPGAKAGGGGAPAAGPGTVSRPPTATIQRPVIARVAPPPPPVPFSAREATLAKDPGRPADPATFVAPRPAATAAAAAPPVKVVAPATPGTPPPAPTVSRSRTNVPPTAAGGAPPAAAGTPPAAPAPGVPPGVAPSRGAALPVPQPPGTPPSAPPSAVRVPPQPMPAPPVQPVPQPPKVMEGRPVPQPPSPAAQPSVAPTPAPAEQRREPPPPPTVNRPPVTPSPPAELRREPPPAVAKPPPAPSPPLAEPRREAIPPPAPAVAKPPPAPSPPPAELRREPPPAAVRPPPAPVPPPAELRREPPPPPAPAVAKPPPAPSPPPAELRREPPPPPAPAAVRPPPASAPPPAELRREPPPPPAVARPPVVPTPPPAEPKAKVEPPRGEVLKGKGEEKRDDQK
jgi:hypothetical protein